MEEVFVCMTSPPPFQEDIFLRWVKGEAYEQQSSRTESTSLFQFRHPVVSSFCDDLSRIEQYRVFDVLEHFMCQPLLLNSQMMIQIPLNVQKFIVQKYWGLNDSVVREIVYKRLNKSRKDLDDVSDLTGLNLKCVTRQFDNLKRIYTFIEDNQWQCNILTSIEKNFLLDPLLARKYSCVIFLQYSKFNLTSKKRMQRVCGDGLEKCAALTLVFLGSDSESFFKSVVAQYFLKNDSKESASLTATHTSPLDYYEVLLYDELCWPIVWEIFTAIDTVELDKQMLINLRDLRTILTGEVLDVACSLVRQAIVAKGGIITTRRLLDVARIRTVLKSLMQIGGHLSQTREYRDMLEDVLAKVVEPLEEASLTTAEIHTFLVCCAKVPKAFPENGRTLPSFVSRSESSSISEFTASSMAVIKKISRTELLRIDWLRFLSFSRLCISQLTKE
jgi:Acidic fibroblast growth factor binding (FIBP)